ncbi:MAG: DNA polymerase III subunit alpha [Methanofastidiosum sp.]
MVENYTLYDVLKNYTIYHLHSDLSILDSATKFEAYIEKAKQNGMTSLGFSEHGNIYQWIKKKQKCDEAGLKYIHGQEFYVTEFLEEKVRDNWHCILIARNLEGVKELNRLSSLAYQKDGHFYYDPRITLEELINTSDNIIITTACIGGILANGTDNAKSKFLAFLIKNKHRCFLEIQHHNDKDGSQASYNKFLFELHKRCGIPLIAGTDSHNLNETLADVRRILQTSKNIKYANEEGWDLNFKTYDELIEAYNIQGALPKVIILEAIENTNVLANMVEDFELDFSYKYPKIYDNAEQIFIDKVNAGLVEKGLDTNEIYKKRIEHEIEAIKKNDAIDYLLLQEKITSWCRSNNILPGYSRGSVSGSICAYLLGITEVDSIKYDLNFERFMNPDRVSLSDIDVDYPPNKRDRVKEYVFNELGLHCCDIVAYNTVAKKGAIRDVARALEIPLPTVNEICENITWTENKYRLQYPELFKYVDLLMGVITSVSIHPSGSVVSDRTLEEELGLSTSGTHDLPISQVDMKVIDDINFVKLDILGLDNIQAINDTCELVGIERLNPDNLDFNDFSIWEDIAQDNTSIFQMESDYAGHIIKQLFSKETLARIKKSIGYIDYLSLFAMANGAIRPAGESYRDQMCQGIIHDNGHPALNEMLAPTLGYLVYQEQILEFLNKFCGYTMGMADIVRRGFAKKTGTEQYIPEIKAGFIKTMGEKYNTPSAEAEKLVESFLEIIEDASDYLFSINHSKPYSMIGFACGYLRKHYPLEYLTVVLNINENNKEKTTKIIDYAARAKNIIVRSIEFGKSKANYFFDKENNIIYRGCASIKYLNSAVANELYELSKNEYNNFIDLLVDIEEKTSANTRQIGILIKLNYFKKFGNNQKLLNLYEEFTKGKNKYSKKHKDATKTKRIEALKEIEKTLSNDKIPLIEQMNFENEILGYIQVTFDVDKRYVYIMDIDTKFAPRLECYCLNNGKIASMKIQKPTFSNKPLKRSDIIYINDCKSKPQVRYDNGKFINIEGTKEWWITSYEKKNEEFY